MATKIKIGDLVRYNAGSQRKKTLGLVLDISDDMYMHSKPCALIQWCCVGNGMMPRKASISWDANRKPIVSGSRVWHEIGTWFEVVK